MLPATNSTVVKTANESVNPVFSRFSNYLLAARKKKRRDSKLTESGTTRHVYPRYSRISFRWRFRFENFHGNSVHDTFRLHARGCRKIAGSPGIRFNRVCTMDLHTFRGESEQSGRLAGNTLWSDSRDCRRSLTSERWYFRKSELTNRPGH